MDGTIMERPGGVHLGNCIGNGTNLFRQEQGFTGPYYRCRSCDAHWWYGITDSKTFKRHRPRDCWRRIRRNVNTPDFRNWARRTYPQADLRVLHLGRRLFARWWYTCGFAAWCEYKGFDPINADADRRFAAQPIGAYDPPGTPFLDAAGFVVAADSPFAHQPVACPDWEDIQLKLVNPY